MTKSRETYRIEMEAAAEAAMRACRQYVSVGDVTRGAAAIAEWVDTRAQWAVYRQFYPPDELKPPA